MRLVDRQITRRHLWIAVIESKYRAAGAMDHPANTHLKAGLKQIPGAHRVHLHGRRIICSDRPVDAAKMYDHVDVA